MFIFALPDQTIALGIYLPRASRQVWLSSPALACLFIYSLTVYCVLSRRYLLPSAAGTQNLSSDYCGQCSGLIQTHKFLVTMDKFRHKNYAVRFRKRPVTFNFRVELQLYCPRWKSCVWPTTQPQLPPLLGLRRRQSFRLSNTNADAFAFKVHQTWCISSRC